MACDCQDHFDQTRLDCEADKKLAFAPTFDERASDCRCEPCNVSRYNEFPVQDDELLLWIVVDDTHVKDEDGNLRLKTGFMEDARFHGSSTLRLGRATKSEIATTIDLMVKDKKRVRDGQPKEVIGYITFPAKLARDIFIEAKLDAENGEPLKDDKALKNRTFTTEEKRAFGVYNSGELDRPNHSDILSAGFRYVSKGKINRIAEKFGAAISGYFKEASRNDIIDLGVPD